MGPAITIGMISVESFLMAARGMGMEFRRRLGRAAGTQAFTPLRDGAGLASTFFLAGEVGVL